jgi:uncharacterized membrane protein
MIPPAEDDKLAVYARKLRWALASLPAAERDDIVNEMRSHVLDRIDQGVSMDEALAALGPADDYARAFRDSYAVASALSSRKLTELLSAILVNVLRSAAVAVAAVAIFLAWAAAALALNVTIWKMSDPAHVGLWRGKDFFFIGIIDDPTSGQELLGSWLPVLTLGLVVLAWVVTRVLAVWALKRLRQRT